MSTMTLQSTYTDTVAIGFAGQLDGNQNVSKTTVKNAESTASIPFGTVVAYKPSGSTSDIDATLPANSTDQLRGILFRSDSYSRAWTDDNGTHGELDSTGIRAGALMNIAVKGRILVTCITGCVPGDRAFVCYATGGATYTALGQVGNAADGTSNKTTDITKVAKWDSTASAGGLAWLIFDFTNKE